MALSKWSTGFLPAGRTRWSTSFLLPEIDVDPGWPLLRNLGASVALSPASESFNTLPADLLNSGAPVGIVSDYGNAGNSLKGTGSGDWWYFTGPRFRVNGDFTLYADINLNPDGTVTRDIANLAFWINNEGANANGFMYRLDNTGGGSGFHTVTNGGHSALIGTASPAVAVATWYRVKLQAVGNVVTATLTRLSDGVVIDVNTLDVTTLLDATHTTSGTFGQKQDGAGSTIGHRWDNFSLTKANGSSVGAAPAGTVSGSANILGPVAASAGAAPAGTPSGSANTAAGQAQSVGLAPAGTLSLGARVVGPVAASAGAAPVGSISTGVNLTGPVATSAGTAPAGTVTAARTITLAGPVATTSGAGLSGTQSGSAGVGGVVAASSGAAPAGTVSVVRTVNLAGPVAQSAGASYTGGVIAGVSDTIAGPVATSAGVAPAGVVSGSVNVVGPVATSAGVALAGSKEVQLSGPVANTSGAAGAGTLGLDVTLSPVGGGANYDETFNKTNSAVIGATLTFTDLSGDLQNVSNRAEMTVNGTVGRSRAEHDTVSADQFAEIVVGISTPSTSTNVVGVCLRYDPVNDTCYSLRDSRSATGVDTMQILKIVAGVATVLASATFTLATGDTLRFEVSGTSLTGYRNGIAVLTTNNTAITSGTRGGIEVRAGTAAARTTTYIDNFTFGDLVAVGGVASSAAAAPAGTVQTEIAVILTAQPAASVGGVPVGNVTAIENVTLLGPVAGSAVTAPNGSEEGDAELTAGVATANSVAPAGSLSIDINLLGAVAQSVGASYGDISTSDVLPGSLAMSTGRAVNGFITGDANVVGEVARSAGQSMQGGVVGDVNILGAVAQSTGTTPAPAVHTEWTINLTAPPAMSNSSAYAGTVDWQWQVLLTTTPASSVGAAPDGDQQGDALITGSTATGVSHAPEGDLFTSWVVELLGAVAEALDVAVPGFAGMTIGKQLIAIWTVALGVAQRQKDMVYEPPTAPMRGGRQMVQPPARVMQPSRRSMVELPRTMAPEVRE